MQTGFSIFFYISFIITKCLSLFVYVQMFQNVLFCNFVPNWDEVRFVLLFIRCFFLRSLKSCGSEFRQRAGKDLVPSWDEECLYFHFVLKTRCFGCWDILNLVERIFLFISFSWMGIKKFPIHDRNLQINLCLLNLIRSFHP